MPGNLLDIPDVVLDGKSLSAEARQIADEAAKPLKDWVAASLKEIADKSAAEITKAVTALKADLDAAEKLLDENQTRLKALQASFANLQIPAGSDALQQAATNLVNAANAAAADLEAQRKKFREGGRLAGELAIKTIKTAFTLL